MAMLDSILNPFRIYHQRRDAKTRARQISLGTDHNYHLTWDRTELPGAGAGQYAWETYGLPPYAAFGFGNINVTNPLRETFPASYVFQAVGVVGIPPTSILQGQFITQPLLDPNSAVMMGVVQPGVLAGAPNAINNASPTLSG